MFGVRRICGIHIIYSGAVIRGDRQGLFYGKFEAFRCGTHLLTAGSPIVEVRHRRIFLRILPTFGYRKRTVEPSFLFYKITPPLKNMRTRFPHFLSRPYQSTNEWCLPRSRQYDETKNHLIQTRAFCPQRNHFAVESNTINFL